MLLRYDPFREFDRLTDGVARRPGFMAMDARRSGDTVTVEFDLPGVDRSSIDLTVERHQLVVEAQRSRVAELPDDDGAETTHLASERPHGTFRRTLQLGDNLDTDRISADYADGVLRLTIPMSDAAKPRKIELGEQAALST